MNNQVNAGVVIAGAGHAGGNAAALLRQYGYQGPITLIGNEPAAPYQRPPLSKAYLKGETPLERLAFKPANFYADNQIDLKTGVSVRAVHRAAKRVELSDGSTLAYDKLILATGAQPRPFTLEGHALDGVLTLRTLADADALRARLQPGARLAVIGAGYIGLEAAASARQLGYHVTVLEAAPRVLGRVTCEQVSAFYESQHRAQGVDLRVNVKIDALIGEDGRLSGVKLASGEIVPATVALVGIGIVPDLSLAEPAGLQHDNGIVVDEDARTSDPDIFAIGDCTQRPLLHYGRSGRLESVHNALEQAKLAASAIAGKPRPACEVPWFWSDQYDLKLQTAGLHAGYDQIVMRGSPEARSFALYYLKGRTLLAVDAINAMADFMCGKKLAGTGIALDIEALRAAETDIKQFTAAAAASGA